jgi:exopolyphosphatase / guanosine-5'-triphosphate,3'-diphosphate pyrophosphatase
VRVAAIDCGTNSIRLLVADVSIDASGRVERLVDLDRRLEIVRLGEGVDRTGRLAPQALARTLEACTRYATRIVELAAERTRFVATSATRDADNRAEFVGGVRALLGVEPEVVTGDEEARLSFVGSTQGLHGLGLAAPYLVVDIGGGSTEFVLGAAEPGAGEPTAAVSVDMGCVRLTERCLPGDPPTGEEIARARAEVDRQLDKAAASVPLEQARTLVGLAGTVTTVAAMALDLPTYDADRLHHARIPAAAVHAATTRVLAMNHDKRRALPYMHPGRVDVIGGGALILDRIVERVGHQLAVDEVVVSEHDILDGIAMSCVER